MKEKTGREAIFLQRSRGNQISGEEENRGGGSSREEDGTPEDRELEGRNKREEEDKNGSINPMNLRIVRV